MANFEALIKATLETGNVQDQINKKINPLPVNLKNITIDQKSIQAQIQSAIDNGSFQLKINGVNLSGLNRQIDNAGKTVGNNYASNIQDAMNRVMNKSSNSSIAKSFLASYDIPDKTINKVTKNIDRLGLTIESISGINRGKDNTIDITVKGTDSLGNAATAIQKFNAQTGEFVSGSVKATQSLKDMDSIMSSLNTKEFDLAVAKVSTQADKFGSIGGSNLASAKSGIQELKNLLSSMRDPGNSNLVADYEKFEQILSRVRNELGIVREENKKYVSSLEVSTLDNKMSTWLSKNTRATKDFGNQIETLRSKLKSLNDQGVLDDVEYKRIIQEFEGIKQAAISAGKVGKSFGTTLKNAFQGIFGVISVATVLRQVAQLLKQMYQEVLAIDTAMVSLKKVTDETESSYAKFLDRSASSAKELGRTISSFVEQTASWSKLGYNLSEAEKLAKLSSVYSNVAEVDDATAVSDIVTALKAKRMPWFTEMCA